jgi:hypothetical protein
MGMHGRVKLHDDFLILGLASPGKDFDIFLEPLVEDLLELWSGVRL